MPPPELVEEEFDSPTASTYYSSQGATVNDLLSCQRYFLWCYYSDELTSPHTNNADNFCVPAVSIFTPLQSILPTYKN